MSPSTPIPSPRRVAPDPEHGRAMQRKYQEFAPRAPEGGFDLAEICPPSVEIEMEIGFGRGLFLLQRAQAAPHALVLGIEIKKKLAYQVEQHRQALGLGPGRARVMAGDVRSVLPSIRPDAAIARVFVNFPDPWWKKRHAKRRVLAEAVLEQIARLLRPGGELFVQTDVEERAEQCLEQLRAHPAFELSGSGYVPENPYGARSNREQRAIADGVPVYRVLARRSPV